MLILFSPQYIKMKFLYLTIHFFLFLPCYIYLSFYKNLDLCFLAYRASHRSIYGILRFTVSNLLAWVTTHKTLYVIRAWDNIGSGCISFAVFEDFKWAIANIIWGFCCIKYVKDASWSWARIFENTDCSTPLSFNDRINLIFKSVMHGNLFNIYI